MPSSLRFNPPCLQWKGASSITRRQLLERRYGEDPMSNPFESLLYTRQTETVSEYAYLVTSRLVHIPGIADNYCLGMFLHGLKDEIRLRIHSRDAQDLFDTIHLACEIERELGAVRGLSRSMTSTPFKPPGDVNYPVREETSQNNKFTNQEGTFSGGQSIAGVGSTGSTGTQNNSSSTSSINQFGGRPPRELSQKEYLEKRARGECYRCKERYFPGHKCAYKALQVVVLLDPDDDPPLASELGEPPSVGVG
ncbi:hypothetical protein OROGR_004525 [Orobanche gracilis]